jgi:hypothetical protein
MPLYQTLHDNGSVIGVYNAQRPSVAACKAFTTLRRINPSENALTIRVVTEGRKLSQAFNVHYAMTHDAFFGEIMRPVATPARLKVSAGHVLTE